MIKDKGISKPPWLKIRPQYNETYREVKNLISEMQLHTVCQEATCPNIGQCFSARTATFIILGDICTRGCRFCDVSKGLPSEYDLSEPRRVSEACLRLNLKHAVITSVTRDDLADGGGAIFAETAKLIKAKNPTCGVELLIPDLLGNIDALEIILDAKPDILAHNLETVPRLYKIVRPKASYERSLHILQSASQSNNNIIVKTGIMVGLGESEDEVLETIKDSINAGCKIMTIGQYLRPSDWHLPIEKYYPPEWFEMIKNRGESMGMAHIEAGPLVRSSFMAHRQIDILRKKLS